MELKNYQKMVMKDLKDYMKALSDAPELFKAWSLYWSRKDITVGRGGVPPYNNSIQSVPHVCMKVPTGGGKTFMACAALRPIFEALPFLKEKLVIWLVPSQSILQQTVRNLSNPSHPYRLRLSRDFQGRVEVLTKEELLTGQNFSPDTVREELSVCVLSYDSLRINSRKKDVRKVYQENGALYRFKMEIAHPEACLPDTPDTALIQVLRQLSPVVVVDESHNASSDLSVEMLERLNPSFVLDLTATPRVNSNVISYVDARELKKEHMVKLPVIVYNRPTKDAVIGDAIRLRRLLEERARSEEKRGAPYIRPIVLFQAQPRTGSGSETFEKVKRLLMEVGIPEKEIAIKTSTVDDLKEADLLSRDCPIRYIITVNALKEGWDCPFAYILASLANKTSPVDVEQILGRVLRQPYAVRQEAAVMNLSYVLTCSADFRNTLDHIVLGLNGAGFSSKDYRIGEEIEERKETPVEQASLFPQNLGVDEVKKDEAAAETDLADVDTTSVASYIRQPDLGAFLEGMPGKESGEGSRSLDPLGGFVKTVEKAESAYIEEGRKEAESGRIGGELGAMLKQYEICEEWRDEVLRLALPQFVVATELPMSFFGGEGEKRLLTKEYLMKGFSLSAQDAKIPFSRVSDDMYTVDLSVSGDAVPKYRMTSRLFGAELREELERMPSKERLAACIGLVAGKLSKQDALNDTDVRKYLKRVIAQYTEEELERVMQGIESYASVVEGKIKKLAYEYQKTQFKDGTQTVVTCAPMWHFPQVITPQKETSAIPKSLYTAEANDMNDFEWQMANDLARMENVRWWHRNIDRRGFFINGFLNHYPDFLVMTKAGRLLAVETKGDFLANEDSLDKLELGKQWASMAGLKYRYFMVFEHQKPQQNGAYTREEFFNLLRQIP